MQSRTAVGSLEFENFDNYQAEPRVREARQHLEAVADQKLGGINVVQAERARSG